MRESAQRECLGGIPPRRTRPKGRAMSSGGLPPKDPLFYGRVLLITERYPAGASGFRRRCSYLCCRRCPVIALGWVYRPAPPGRTHLTPKRWRRRFQETQRRFDPPARRPFVAGRRSEPHSSAAIAGWKVPVESGGPSNRGILKGEADYGNGPPFGPFPSGGIPLKRALWLLSLAREKVTPPSRPQAGHQKPGRFGKAPPPAGAQRQNKTLPGSREGFY